MKMKLAILAILLAVVTFNTQAATTTVSGLVTVLHYNGAATYAGTQRGVCVQLSPAISNTWRCAYKTNHLYDEFHAALVMSKTLNIPVKIISQDDWSIELVELQ